MMGWHNYRSGQGTANFNLIYELVSPITIFVWHFMMTRLLLFSINICSFFFGCFAEWKEEEQASVSSVWELYHGTFGFHQYSKYFDELTITNGVINEVLVALEHFEQRTVFKPLVGNQLSASVLETFNFKFYSDGNCSKNEVDDAIGIPANVCNNGVDKKTGTAVSVYPAVKHESNLYFANITFYSGNNCASPNMTFNFSVPSYCITIHHHRNWENRTFNSSGLFLTVLLFVSVCVFVRERE